MLELISQIDIETYFLGVVRVVESCFQWSEHTIHSIAKGTTEHAFLVQDILDFSAT